MPRTGCSSPWRSSFPRPASRRQSRTGRAQRRDASTPSRRARSSPAPRGLRGVRADEVRRQDAGLRVREPGRRPVQRAGGVRQADPEKEMPVTIGVFVMPGG